MCINWFRSASRQEHIHCRGHPLIPKELPRHCKTLNQISVQVMDTTSNICHLCAKSQDMGCSTVQCIGYWQPVRWLQDGNDIVLMGHQVFSVQDNCAPTIACRQLRVGKRRPTIARRELHEHSIIYVRVRIGLTHRLWCDIRFISE